MPKLENATFGVIFKQCAIWPNVFLSAGKNALTESFYLQKQYESLTTEGEKRPWLSVESAFHAKMHYQRRKEFIVVQAFSGTLCLLQCNFKVTCACGANRQPD